MAKCKGCGAEIIWIKTPSGSRHPCDPEQVTYWARPRATGRVVTPNGEVITCDFEGDLHKATGMGYVSHFSTCPAADRFRRRKDQT
ncbi:MAG: hypothetical protein II010_07785 [Oscillospiraceae bacterium]|nr:hypothetical protein [Oscillospiraceae bacterium]